MFDLDKKIMQWKLDFAANGVASPEALDELEAHLREEVERQVRAGLSPEEAFERAARQLGEHETLRREFEKIDETPGAAAQTRRIKIVERDVMLPAKAVAILMLVYFFGMSNWIAYASTVYEVAVEVTSVFVWPYIAVNLAMAGLLLVARRLPLVWLQAAAMTMSIADGLFLSLLCFVTGGYTSSLYWLFLGLIMRNSINFPRIGSQALLNLSVISCYAFAGILSISFAAHLTETERRVMSLYAAENGEVQEVLMRLMLLLVTAVCCFLVQSMLSQRRLRSTAASPA